MDKNDNSNIHLFKHYQHLQEEVAVLRSMLSNGEGNGHLYTAIGVLESRIEEIKEEIEYLLS